MKVMFVPADQVRPIFPEFIPGLESYFAGPGGMFSQTGLGHPTELGGMTASTQERQTPSQPT